MNPRTTLRLSFEYRSRRFSRLLVIRHTVAVVNWQENSVRLFGKLVLSIFAVLVAAYAVFAYGRLPLGSTVHPEMREVFVAHASAIYIHVFASAVALVLGPLQFSSWVRSKFINVHRWCGRIYLGVGVGIGGLAGLYMSQFAFGGLVSNLGFAFLALGWLSTGTMALSAILRGDIFNHRKWMTRNYSLTFAAVTLRIYLGSSFAMGLRFEHFYPVISWLAWVPNLIVAELLVSRLKRERPAPAMSRTARGDV